LIDEKTTLSTARDAARDKINARINEEKNARSELKFNNLASIESQIRELEARQARTTMSLQDEKKILKDIHQLQMSKKTVATLADMKAAIELLKQQKIEIDRNFNEKSGQVKNVNERITAQRAVLEGLTKDNSEQREALPGLRSRQNEIKKVVDDKYQEIKTLRQEFKAKEEAFYLALAEERQRKKEQKQKEIEAKKAADEARRKAE
jgi:chromosome segregation ATPase